MNEKIRLLKRFVGERGFDALFFHWKDPSHKWLLGRELQDSFILIRKAGKPLLFISPLEDFKSEGFKVLVADKNLKDKIIGLGIKKLAVNFSYFTLRNKKIFGKALFVNVEKDMLDLRSVKSGEELKNIRKACALTVKCFRELVKEWKKKPFRHEMDVVRFIKRFALDYGLGLAFEPIVASGKNASVPHHSNNTKMNKGFCVIDFGFEYNGYMSDMTRTVFIGNPGKEEKDVYELVRNTQEECVGRVMPGFKCKDLHELAIKRLGQYSKYFIHSLGHGIGVQGHESPGISTSSKESIREGMVLTVEPGVYMPKKRVGIRIEDTIIARKGKPEVLTGRAPKNLILINLP